MKGVRGGGETGGPTALEGPSFYTELGYSLLSGQRLALVEAMA